MTCDTMRALAAIGGLLLLAGCGDDLPRRVPVSGQVLFDGGPCPGRGTVYFLPLEGAEGFPLRPATAEFGVDGKFRVATFDAGDGLLPGKYQMHVECYETPPNMDGKPVKSHVPPQYQSAQTSGFALEITPDMRSREIELDLITKKRD
ncbi:MAG: hypothetical protein SFU86_00430 [Pirellulaceae bacterium]|nr:hypothetical protein [Pirellulaceae bacterium]